MCGRSAVGVHGSREAEASREYGPGADSAMVAPGDIRSARHMDEIDHLCMATATINFIDHQRKPPRKRYQNLRNDSRRCLSDSPSGHSYII